MSIIHPETKELKDKVFSVIDNLIHGMFRVEFSFLGFPDVNIDTIDQFDIVQDFQGAYSDVIHCSLTLFPEQMIQVVQAYQDLRCSFTFTRVENNTGIINPDYGEPLQFEYRVLIQNPLDLLKKLNSREFLKPEDEADKEQYQSIRVPLSMQLVDQQVYDLRHIEFTDNWNKITVKKALETMATIFKYPDVQIIEPDNTREYEHMPIPPMLNFSNAFSFLQERYGVYNYGIATYIHDKKLLIYPRTENVPKEPIAPGTLHIYKVATDQYLGSDGYASKEGEDICVICNKPVDMQDNSEANAEAVGNAAVATRTDMAVDINREVIEGGIKQNPQEAVTLISPNSNTAVPNIQNAKYVTAQDNVHQLMSNMSAGDCTVAKIQVQYLDPFTIYPNHPCIFHYEENGEYKTVQGVVVGCSYRLKLEGRPSAYVYGFQSALILRLVPDKKEGTVT
jgi:hypothetical protein